MDQLTQSNVYLVYIDTNTMTDWQAALEEFFHTPGVFINFAAIQYKLALNLELISPPYSTNACLMAGFGGRVLLGDLDDFIAPSQVCPQSHKY